MNKVAVMAVGVACALPALAKIELGTPFADGAVLQREMEVPVWGTAEAGRRVTVSFADAEVSTVVGASGAWTVRLPKMAASKEGRTLTLEESEPGWFGLTTDTVEVKDVLVGEVWFASGQSNMECPIVSGNPRYRDGSGFLLVEMTHLPFVRFAKSAHQWSVQPKKVKFAGWKRLEPSSFEGSTLSAVAFYYARELYLALDVPIGIVDASWGGTNIDAWTPRCGYEGCDASIAATAAYPVKADWKKETDRTPVIGDAHQQPTVLFNGMVDSWAPMAMRGFIWYQGCHNAGEWQTYCAKMHALYDGWSRRFENPGLKLYFVQLAPYASNWNYIVGAQDRFALEEPNAAIAVTADVGNFDDIHPNNKEIVAKRLAVHALKRDYGLGIAEDCSPVFKKATFSGNEARMTFDHVQRWYVYAPNRSVEPAFEIKTAAGQWVPAKLQNVDNLGLVKGTDLVVTAGTNDVATAVRYMRQRRTMSTLYNQVSLPLGPFDSSGASK